MNPRCLAAAALCAVVCQTALLGEEAAPETDGLRHAAEAFVSAYNTRDATAVAALFTDAAALSDAGGRAIASGRPAIQRHYERLFSGADAPSLAIEVDGVRLVSPGVALESGTFHLTRPGADEPFRSAGYAAVLVKREDGAWRIASNREGADATAPQGRLEALAKRLEGEWTCQKDGMRFEIAFTRNETGRVILGEMLATTADAPPQRTTLRLAWDGARKTVTWWTFDDGGGFASGDWTPEGEEWSVVTHGTTADGEATRASSRLAFDGQDAITWSITRRLVDGERLDDVELRLVRQAPAPVTE